MYIFCYGLLGLMSRRAIESECTEDAQSILFNGAWCCKNPMCVCLYWYIYIYIERDTLVLDLNSFLQVVSKIGNGAPLDMWIVGFPVIFCLCHRFELKEQGAMIQAVAQNLLWRPMCCPITYLRWLNDVKCTHDLSQSYKGKDLVH